jgi:hypothetical protein
MANKAEYECFNGPMDGKMMPGSGEPNNIMLSLNQDTNEYHLYRLVQNADNAERPPMYYQYEGTDAEELMARMLEEDPHVFDDAPPAEEND